MSRELSAAEYAEVVRFGVHDPDVIEAMEEQLGGSEA